MTTNFKPSLAVMSALLMLYYVTLTEAASVIVIGGGASGLSAGATLLSAGYDVTVLEGNSKLGGRMSPRHLVTDDPTSPIVEQGANWIHGYKSNYVLWPLATKLGMHGAHTNYSDNPGPQDPSAPRAIYMTSIHNGAREAVPKNASDFWQARFDSAFEGCTEVAEKHKAGQKDISVTACLEQVGFFDNVDRGSHSLDDRLSRYFSWEMTSFEDTSPPSSLSNSYCWPTNEGMNAYDDWLVVDPRGYVNILTDPAGGIGAQIIQENRVRLNAEAKEVLHVPAAAGVGEYVQVTTTSGDVYRADYVVSTMSLGVMKAAVSAPDSASSAAPAVSFQPAFSQDKVKAIKGMGFGSYGKIWATFDEKFWGDEEIFKIAGDNDDSPGAAPWALNLDIEKYIPGSKTLNFHIAGTACKDVEKHGEDSEYTRKFVRHALTRLFGDHVPEPTAIKTTSWLVDPLVRGSYSYWPLGYTEAQFNLMLAPEWGGRLHFAGEHTSASHYGYVHGAIESGQRAAQEIITAAAAAK